MTVVYVAIALSAVTSAGAAFSIWRYLRRDIQTSAIEHTTSPRVKPTGATLIEIDGRTYSFNLPEQVMPNRYDTDGLTFITDVKDGN